MTKRVERFDLAGLQLGDQVRDRLAARVEVEQDADVAELEGAVDDDDRLPSSVAAATARLTATVVRPTPPFGLKTATTSPGSPERVGRRHASGRPSRRGARRHPAALVALAGVDLSDRRGQLVAELNGLTRNSRAPASIERRR